MKFQQKDEIKQFGSRSFIENFKIDHKFEISLKYCDYINILHLNIS